MKSVSPSSSPPEPLIKIRPRKSWSFTGDGELWAYRELLYFLIWRDLKVRYKQTALGYLWVVLQPLSMTLVFAFFLGMLGHVPSDDVPYSVFAYAGLVTWVFFTNAILSSSYSLIGNANLITKVYFPRYLYPDGNGRRQARRFSRCRRFFGGYDPVLRICADVESAALSRTGFGNDAACAQHRDADGGT